VTGLLEAEPFTERPKPAAGWLRHGLALLAIWASGCVLLLLFFRDNLVSTPFSDADDYMRLQEVRDWMAGQNWFDVTQYRIDPPGGLLMHWSRLVDLPLAGVIALMRPLVGAAQAETIACATVPLVTLGLVGLSIAAITRRLMRRPLALAAMASCMVAPEILWAARPMRIDHHGWQLACAAAMAMALIGNVSVRRAAIAGLCAALWMHISLEGLPFTAACGGWLGLRWLIAPDEQRWRLPAFLGSAAAGSLVFFLIAHGGALFDRTFCDAVSPVHIVMLAIAAAGASVACSLSPRDKPARGIMLGGTALACALVYRLWAPQCAGGPFATLDPLTYHLWYLAIPEGLPIWRQTPQAAALSVAYPLVGLAGCFVGWWHAPAGQRAAWLDLAALLTAAILTAALLARASSVSNALAIPGALALLPAAAAAMRRLTSLPPRVLLGAGASLLALPLAVDLLAIACAQSGAAENHDRGAAIASAHDCMTPANLATLDRLPASLILTPLDEAPAVIVGTHHMAVGGGYHRNPAVMRDVLSTWIGDEANARRIMTQHKATYLFFCPGDAELRLTQGFAPQGFGARLAIGTTPGWLHSVAIPKVSGRLYAIAR
jgi:hypothetical protein